MSDALLRCPFCGGEASFANVRYDPRTVREQEWKQDTFHYVSCERCASNNRGLVGFDTREQAAAHWNTRSVVDQTIAAPVPAPPAEPTMSYANAEEYAKRNPLGGVARVFDIMADRLRAGESLQSVLDDYGYAVAAPAAEPAITPRDVFDMMRPRENTAAEPVAECPTCRGNDKDIPCTYPGLRMRGCLRDKRLIEQGQLTDTEPGEGCTFALTAQGRQRAEQQSDNSKAGRSEKPSGTGDRPAAGEGGALYRHKWPTEEMPSTAPAAEPALTRDEQDAIRRQLYAPAAEPVAQPFNARDLEESAPLSAEEIARRYSEGRVAETNDGFDEPVAQQPPPREGSDA